VWKVWNMWKVLKNAQFDVNANIKIYYSLEV